jgi:hypothetical protein
MELEWLAIVFPNHDKKIILDFRILAMKMNSQFTKLILAGVLFFVYNPDTSAGNGTPSGSIPGGTRPACSVQTLPEDPKINPSKISTFQFNIPYRPDEIRSINFWVQNRKIKKTIYKASPNANETSKPLVFSPELQSGADYFWKFTLRLKCDLPNMESSPNTTISRSSGETVTIQSFGEIKF